MQEFEKNWNFIKLHLHVHVFDDISEKGAIRNMSTKPNEKMHGPLRKIYLNQTNFKNVGDQVPTSLSSEFALKPYRF